MVDGKAVEQKIDATITPLIKSYYPGLDIGAPQCEPIVAIVRGTMGKCTLPVNGVPLPVRVASAGPPDMFKVDFAGGVHTAAIPGVRKLMRIGFWIDPVVGFHVRPIDAVIDRGKVQQMAQEDVNRRLSENGDTPDAVVTCAKGLIVVKPPATFDCRLTSGRKRYRLLVNVQDWKGTVSWRGSPIK